MLLKAAFVARDMINEPDYNHQKLGCRMLLSEKRSSFRPVPDETSQWLLLASCQTQHIHVHVAMASLFNFVDLGERSDFGDF